MTGGKANPLLLVFDPVVDVAASRSTGAGIYVPRLDARSQGAFASPVHSEPDSFRPHVFPAHTHPSPPARRRPSSAPHHGHPAFLLAAPLCPRSAHALPRRVLIHQAKKSRRLRFHRPNTARTCSTCSTACTRLGVFLSVHRRSDPTPWNYIPTTAEHCKPRSEASPGGPDDALVPGLVPPKLGVSSATG